MKRSFIIALIGLGAIGMSFGQKIHEGFPDKLTVIADQKRIERYEAQPFTVNGKPVQFHFQAPEEATGPKRHQRNNECAG